MDLISEPSNRAATTAEPTYIESVQHIDYRSGKTSLQFLDEPYKLVYSGVVFKKSGSFVEVFNEMVAKMEPNGLMERWRRFESYSRTKFEEVGPQVLTMDHLKLGFLACCISMVLAIIAFIGESAWSRFVTSCRKSSNDQKKLNACANCEANIFSSELQTHLQERNHWSEELIELHSVAVEKIYQQDRVDIEDSIESYNIDDDVRACQELLDEIDDLKKHNYEANGDSKIFTSEFRGTQSQKRNLEFEEPIESYGTAVAEIHQEARDDFKNLIKIHDDDDLMCEELFYGIEDVVDK